MRQTRASDHGNIAAAMRPPRRRRRRRFAFKCSACAEDEDRVEGGENCFETVRRPVREARAIRDGEDEGQEKEAADRFFLKKKKADERKEKNDFFFFKKTVRHAVTTAVCAVRYPRMKYLYSAGIIIATLCVCVYNKIRVVIMSFVTLGQQPHATSDRFLRGTLASSGP